MRLAARPPRKSAEPKMRAPDTPRITVNIGDQPRARRGSIDVLTAAGLHSRARAVATNLRADDISLTTLGSVTGSP